MFRSPATSNRLIRLFWPGLALTLCFLLLAGCQKGDDTPIKVGVLHSQTGPMAISEQPVVDATLLAIEEINAQGGLLGRKLLPVVVDGKSDPDTFAREAERLITEEKVSAIFGCWTSVSRKAVKPIVEQHENLLFYPVQYEGMEQSPHIVYTGAIPSQQILPTISWANEHLGKRLYLVGSDYVFPRIANWIIRKQAALLGMQIVGESYLPLGSEEFTSVTAEISRRKPDVIINTVSGSSNSALFKALYDADLRAESTPVISFSIGEIELATMPAEQLLGNYAAWSYFQSIDTAENRAFVAAFRARYGQQRILGDPMEAAYFGVKLWAQAAKISESVNPADILATLTSQSLAAPEGIISMGLTSQHTWRSMRIGKINNQRQFDIVWQSPGLLRPNPWPLKILREDASTRKSALYGQWNQQWAAPVPEEKVP